MRTSVVAAGVLAVAALAAATAARAQDVEMLGRRHGVRPPQAYYEIIARDPTAFQFRRVWIEEARRVRERRRALARAGNFDALNAHFTPGGPSPSAAAAAGTAVTGTFRIPVLMGFFQDSTHVLQPSVAEIDSVLFDTTAPPYSVRTYYDEVSNGLVTVVGDVFGWHKADSVAAWYEGSNNGLDPSTDHTGDFIRELLDAFDATVDFSQYDRNGDGVVDLLAVLHPLRGGECGSSHIWSHRWVYRAWFGSPYATNDGVQVDDYIIQPAVGGTTGCDSTQIMPIGTFTHELGHGMAGLPDLYNTQTRGPGVGVWDLMAAGANNTPTRPAHLSAWSKEDVGWIAVDTILAAAPATTRTLRPIVTSDTAIRIHLTDTNEYFLLENRRRLGSDANLRGEGLLIWHIDPDSVATRRAFNQVNARLPFAVALEQADGLFQLENEANSGDAGDPYPGSTNNTAFGPGTTPASTRNDGTGTGLGIDSITVNPDGSVAFRVRFNLVEARVTTNVPGTEVIVDGAAFPAPYDVVWEYPSTHTIAVDSIQGDTLVRHVWESWSDGGAREHQVTADDAVPDTFLATLRTEHRLRATATAGGTVQSSVPLDSLGVAWLVPTATVTLVAQPDTAAGYVFVEWAGDTASVRDTLALAMGRPWTVSAVFGFPVAVTSTTLAQATMGANYADTLEATGGSGVYTWSLVSGSLPAGLALDGGTGVVSGVPAEDGTFSFVVRAQSGALSDSATVSVTVVQPVLDLQEVVDHLLGKALTLSADELRYLDLLGNKNGSFDIGDFRAYLIETGVVSAAVADAARAGAPADTAARRRDGEGRP